MGERCLSLVRASSAVNCRSTVTASALRSAAQAAASLYEAFPPAEAKRLWAKLEVHHTPKHGSWLNVAEIELSVLARQCLDRRIPDQAALAAEVAAWERDRNADQTRVDWRFTTADARIRLKRLYPSQET